MNIHHSDQYTSLGKLIGEYSRILNLLFNEIIVHNYFSTVIPTPLSKNQFSILRILKTNGSLLINEIAAFMQITNAAASKNIEKLVHYKLVKRQIVATNRRTTRVFLSETGEKIVNKFESIRSKKQKRALESFSPEEQKQLSELFGKYIHLCLNQEKNLGLVCHQCTGKVISNCTLTEYNVKCRFQVN
jgi:DNA-binding MarR family transcriptional regulator